MTSIVDEFRNRQSAQEPKAPPSWRLWAQAAAVFAAVFVVFVWVMQDDLLPDEVMDDLASVPSVSAALTSAPDAPDDADVAEATKHDTWNPRAGKPVESPWKNTKLSYWYAKPEPTEAEKAAHVEEEFATGIWLTLALVGAFTLVMIVLRGGGRDAGVGATGASGGAAATSGRSGGGTPGRELGRVRLPRRGGAPLDRSETRKERLRRRDPHPLIDEGPLRQ